MRRTEQLQGLRLMKFEEVYGRSYRGEPSQLEAAVILGMRERRFGAGGTVTRPRGPMAFMTGALAGSRRDGPGRTRF